MSALNSTSRSKLLKIIGLFGSDQVGERASAAARAHELVAVLGGWDGLLTPAAQTESALIERARALTETLTQWEVGFVGNLARAVHHGRAISAKQRDVLERIVVEAEARRAA